MKYVQIINNFNVLTMKIFIHKDLLFSLQIPVLQGYSDHRFTIC
ncbi:hypothetical protein UYSO10_1729 [Kosakonia radicincitans]|nr:hypothetical protein UYSO10_1729 [Kosakonia radicincitans]